MGAPPTRRTSPQGASDQVGCGGPQEQERAKRATFSTAEKRRTGDTGSRRPTGTRVARLRIANDSAAVGPPEYSRAGSAAPPWVVGNSLVSMGSERPRAGAIGEPVCGTVDAWRQADIRRRRERGGVETVGCGWGARNGVTAAAPADYAAAATVARAAARASLSAAAPSDSRGGNPAVPVLIATVTPPPFVGPDL